MRIANSKVPDATRITDLEDDVFEGRRQDVPSHRTFTFKERHSDVKPSDIIKIWKIGLGTTTKNLKAKNQRMLRLAIMPILRRYMANHMFERPCIKETLFTDNMAGLYKSLDINSYDQVLANDYFFADIYPMENKSLAGQGLRELIADFGVMYCLFCDGFKEQTAKGTYFMK